MATTTKKAGSKSKAKAGKCKTGTAKAAGRSSCRTKGSCGTGSKGKK